MSDDQDVTLERLDEIVEATYMSPLLSWTTYRYHMARTAHFVACRPKPKA